jgi:hypothetical protein
MTRIRIVRNQTNEANEVELDPRRATGTERREAKGVPKAKAIARAKVITFPQAKAIQKTRGERQGIRKTRASRMVTKTIRRAKEKSNTAERY